MAPVRTQTIGCDFFENTIAIRGETIRLSVVDIGGQSVASRNLPNYLSGATLVLVVYDVTNPESFRNVVGAVRSIVVLVVLTYASGTGGLARGGEAPRWPHVCFLSRRQQGMLLSPLCLPY